MTWDVRRVLLYATMGSAKRSIRDSGAARAGTCGTRSAGLWNRRGRPCGKVWVGGRLCGSTGWELTEGGGELRDGRHRSRRRDTD